MADRFVLTLINKRIVDCSGFLQKENGAVIMDDDTRKKFLAAWQVKKKEVITHSFLDENDGVGDGTACSGNASGHIYSWRSGRVSAIFMEVGDRMQVLITYDVNTETEAEKRRLRKVAKQCVNYGQRVQNSVFECNLDAAKLRQVKAILEDIIDKEVDSLRFYNLGNKYKDKIEHIGAK